MVRGLVCGAMTFLGGIGHTIPFLISDFRAALALATVVVVIELVLIAWIRKRYMDTPFVKACLQVILGGGIVFAAGIIIGSS